MSEISPKKCSKCKEFKPATLEYFYKESGRKDGFSAICKKCAKTQAAQYYQNNRQKLIDDSRKRYRSNPQMYIDTVRRYKKQNPEKGEGDPEKHLMRGIKSYYANIEKRQQQAREWFVNNPEKAKVIYHRRRARVKGNGGSFTIEEWQALCSLYDYRCLCCKEQKPLTIDHVIPISKGGSNDIWNIQPLCLDCNKKKHTKIIDYR